MNFVTLVGKIYKDIEMREDKKIGELTIAVNRNFKNEQGEYETDYIPIEVRGSVCDGIYEYCEINDVIGIKGRIEADCNGMTIVADKVSFISSGSKENG